MTKYILTGGGDQGYPEYATQLARVIGNEIKNPKVLSCWFSNPDEDGIQKFNQYRNFLVAIFGDDAEIICASKEDFISQLQYADVVYLHGGLTDLLIESMKVYDNLEESFKGKIVIGSSAGANYLANYGYSPTMREVRQGSGLVDRNVIVHYGSQGYNDMTFTHDFWVEAIKHIKKTSESDEVVLLPEGTFTVIDIQ